MSDRMTPLAFHELMNWILGEQRHGSVFELHRPYVPVKGKFLEIYGEKLETPFGPAAGPATQLSQNLVASYYAGARFFELKTVQTLDGEDLPVSKPCILAEHEGYNVEWSTELRVPEAFEEYVKGWFALKLLSREFGWGDPDGFVFNMSVGYNFEGITSEKIDTFIEGLKDASSTPIWAECRAWAKANLHRFQNVDEAYLDGLSPRVCRSITLSTLHGCPPQEIERIASYLIETKKLHTFVKCNPTLLGYDFARRTLDEMGYDEMVFDDHHFRHDLQWEDAVPMFRRLQALADRHEVTFGLKLTNTFPVKIARGELPGEEMYMSGRPLYPLTLELARRVTEEFDGRMRLSFSGGVDAFNIEELFEAGVWPITMATTLLKPGGYQRFTQMGELMAHHDYRPFQGVSVGKVDYLARSARKDLHHLKALKPPPRYKLDEKVPLTTCFTAPCMGGCPINQDIPEYVDLVGQGRHLEALRLIVEKNALPFITGTICSHPCMDKCVRNFYEESVQIRNSKLTAATNAFEALMEELETPARKTDRTVAIVGGGAAGMAAAFFLGRSGVPVTLFEKREKLGGIVRYTVPGFRMPDASIDCDVALMERMGVEVRLGTEAPPARDLLAQGFSEVLLAVGAWSPGQVKLEKGEATNALVFLEKCRMGTAGDLGTDVVVLGGGNTAMDVARVAKRWKGVKRSRIVYRRTRRYMPADLEEIKMALDDGVEILELLAPVSFQDGELVCRKMELGPPDESGRRAPVETSETVVVPCDTLVAAVGEKIDTRFFEENGIELTARGKVKVHPDTLETSVPHVYVLGDANRGPATVVEAIADARKVADALVGRHLFPVPLITDSLYFKHGALRLYDDAPKEKERCLACNTVCEACVQVCPNRAYVSMTVPGLAMKQILHLDRSCNDCGNCTAFCPYDSDPYREKLTLFVTEHEFDGSQTPGFLHLGDRRFKLRLDDTRTVDLDRDPVHPDVEKILDTLLKDYSYLLPARA